MVHLNFNSIHSRSELYFGVALVLSSLQLFCLLSKFWVTLTIMALNFSGLFNGKRALVTGAGKGIGRALTVRLDQEGVIVYAVTRTQADLDSLAQETSRVIPVLLDVADWDAVRTTLTNLLTEPLDILINNAAIAPTQSFLEITKDKLDSQININFTAVVNISQICAQNMVAHGKGGCIVNISSVGALIPLPECSIYNAMKAGMDALTKNISLELGRKNIRVVSINLGEVNTPMHQEYEKTTPRETLLEYEAQMKSYLHVDQIFVPMEEVVKSVLFIASGEAKMMTGCRFILDGGWTA